MHLRLLLIACLAGSAFGCATDHEPAGAAAPQSSSRDSGTYRTGSRLPSYDPPGTAASREISADDWNDGRRNQSNLPTIR
jgi:hypothetical protein